MAKKSTIAIIVLVVLLALSLVYIVYINYSRWQLERQFSVFQQGAQAGFEQGIIQIIQQASTCQQVPLIMGNQTINIIAVDCLQARE